MYMYVLEAPCPGVTMLYPTKVILCCKMLGPFNLMYFDVLNSVGRGYSLFPRDTASFVGFILFGTQWALPGAGYLVQLVKVFTYFFFFEYDFFSLLELPRCQCCYVAENHSYVKCYLNVIFVGWALSWCWGAPSSSQLRSFKARVQGSRATQTIAVPGITWATSAGRSPVPQLSVHGPQPAMLRRSCDTGDQTQVSHFHCTCTISSAQLLFLIISLCESFELPSATLLAKSLIQFWFCSTVAPTFVVFT